MRDEMPFLPMSYMGRWRKAPEGSWASRAIGLHDPSAPEDVGTSPRFARGGE